MAQQVSLADRLFNAGSIGDLTSEFAAGLPGFPARDMADRIVACLPGRALLERLEWIADCLEPHLAPDFPTMADQLEATMPAPLDPFLGDDDFGRFIHAVPGILAARHGLVHHRDRAPDLLYEATQRFSMEFYIRPFLNRWPEAILTRLRTWAEDGNYHVRRLVSEGTRPRLPWAKAVTIMPDETLPLLDRLHGDPTRYVTRSVANHLNDIAKTDPEAVLARLATWERAAAQETKELDWMRRHSLRTLVKNGHPGALEALGYAADLAVQAVLSLGADMVPVGAALPIEIRMNGPPGARVMVDYEITFHRPRGRTGRKVFKLRAGVLGHDGRLNLTRQHRLKGNATTFTLHPGPHRIAVQVNGTIRAEAGFTLLSHR